MSITIQDPKGGEKTVATGCIANSLRCGYCTCPIMEGQTFVVLSAPYLCIVHQPCLSLFDFDGKTRAKNTPKDYRQQLNRELTLDEEVVEKYIRMSRHFKQKMPQLVKDAFSRMVTRCEQIVAWKRDYFLEDPVETETAAEKMDRVIPVPESPLNDYPPEVLDLIQKAKQEEESPK